MKINSRKFLVLSYSLSGKPIRYEHLEYLWPDLSPGGRRSLIALLLKQRLISVQYERKRASFFLSSIGTSLIEEIYFTKALHEESQGFLVMLYPDVILSDPKIVKLRALLKTQCSEVDSKVYFSRLPLTDELESQLKRNYFSCCAMVSMREWVLGEATMFENYYLHKKDSENSLSGISNELVGLIEEKTYYSNANHQSNLRIFSLFDRILSIIDSKTPSEEGHNRGVVSARELLGLFSNLFQE